MTIHKLKMQKKNEKNRKKDSNLLRGGGSREGFYSDKISKSKRQELLRFLGPFLQKK